MKHLICNGNTRPCAGCHKSKFIETAQHEYRFCPHCRKGCVLLTVDAKCPSCGKYVEREAKL